MTSFEEWLGQCSYRKGLYVTDYVGSHMSYARRH